MNNLEAALAPGSLSLLAVAIAAGALAIRRRGRLARVGVVWTTAWVLLYFLLSLPIVARALYRGLSSAPAFEGTRNDGYEAIVLLSGDGARYTLGGERVNVLEVPTTLRVLEAARVYSRLDSPFVIVAGAGSLGAEGPEVQAMCDALVASAVAPDRMVLEVGSRSTHESAIAVRELLHARGITRVVLVTSAQHMSRSMRAFRAAGIDATPAPAPLLPDAGGGGALRFLPRTQALALSALCLHEYVGALYYALRGWA